MLVDHQWALSESYQARTIVGLARILSGPLMDIAQTKRDVPCRPLRRSSRCREARILREAWVIT
jgi:hypothetical protein